MLVRYKDDDMRKTSFTQSDSPTLPEDLRAEGLQWRVLVTAVQAGGTRAETRDGFHCLVSLVLPQIHWNSETSNEI